MFEETPLSFNPVQFFALSCDCCYLSNEQKLQIKKRLIPSTHVLTQEQSFAKIAFGWHENGLSFLVQVESPIVKSVFPKVEKGDSVELFIDTRDLKTAGFNTRFCHHFFFLPQEVEGNVKGEITHFRTEDRHDLCHSNDLQLITTLRKEGYQMEIFIPASCLYGYDPKQFDRIGFTYRINRASRESQHFSVISRDYQIDQQPSLWASIKLIK